MDRNYISTGNAGEYFVAGELERHGLTCAVPMSNTKDFDILAINRESNRQYAIQVKTSSKKDKKWILNEESENLIGKNIIYVFVSLNGIDMPEYHIVPSKIVAEQVRNTHQQWLKKPRKDGDKHKDNNIRNFEDRDDIYLNNWKILK